MRRATPLGHGSNAPAPDKEQHPNTDNPNPAPAAPPAADESDERWAHKFSILRGGKPAEQPHRRSGEHRRRLTPARAVVQPSDPERLRRALEAMREMNKLTRQRTEDMRKLSALSRELSEQMTAFGSVIGGLKIGPERRSVG
jgi:hypothetical protein